MRQHLPELKELHSKLRPETKSHLNYYFMWQVICVLVAMVVSVVVTSLDVAFHAQGHPRVLDPEQEKGRSPQQMAAVSAHRQMADEKTK